MARWRAIAGALAGVAALALGSGAAAGSPAAAPHPILISGGTAAERGLLKAIDHRMAPHQIASLHVGPVPSDWRPEPGDVELIGSSRRSAGERYNLRGIWETWLVGGAFRDRSAAYGLPRVLVVGDDFGAERVQPHFAHPPMADSAGIEAFTAQVTAIAHASGARVLDVQAGRPDGYSAEVTVQVKNVVWFLKNRLDTLLGNLDRLHSDGIFVQLYEPGQKPLLEVGGSTRLQSGLAGVQDIKYLPCLDFFPSPPPFGVEPPLPCPSTWRPPPSTPPKRLHLYGWEAGGQALGEWDGSRGITVAYRPGASFGLQMALANPNGHAVTIEKITPDVASLGPIQYTGVRIQIPPSRDRPGAAGELQPPFTPEPPFRPFTVQPGDWFGAGLHYTVEPTCTAANAGTTVTVNRTFTVTYRRDGRTVRSRYSGVPLNVTYPATCPSGAAAPMRPASSSAGVRMLAGNGEVVRQPRTQVVRSGGSLVVMWGPDAASIRPAR